MKKTLTLAALLLMTAGTALAQEAKNIKVITYQSGKTFSQLLGDDRYEIDSVVIADYYAFGEKNEFDVLCDCCENGRLTGIDLSRCVRIYGREIPAYAFCPSAMNAKPHTGTARRSADSGESEGNGDFTRTNLRYITLPNNLKKIGDYAFAYTNLEKIGIPYWTNAGGIGSGAFHGCEKLKDVILYGRKRHAESNGAAFGDLADGAVLHVAPGLGDSYRTSTGWAAFGSVQEGEVAFKSVDVHLDGSLTLAEALGDDDMRIDSVTLSGTPAAEDLILLKENVVFGRLVGLDLTESTFNEGNLFSCGMESLRMPRHMTVIPHGFLSRSTVNFLTMPESYEEVERTAFEYFKDIPDSTLVIPEGCRKIGYQAFFRTSLKSVTLPATMEKMEPRSLMIYEYLDDTQTVDLYVNRMYPPMSTNEDDEDIYGPFGCLTDAGSPGCMTKNWRLFVPVGAKQNYESAEHWNHFMTIIETPLLTGIPTGIDAAATPAQPQTADGIYTIDGRMVSPHKASPDNLPRGLYIVRENGAARKVVTGR